MKNKVLALFIVAASLVSIQCYGQEKQGLVGILYNDLNLTRITSLWHLNSVNSSETEWSTKNDFSAKWIGYLEAPITGEITFYGEADNEMQIFIEGETVVNTWDNLKKSEGKIHLEKGKQYGIVLKYRQIEGTSYMRVLWSWEGHEKQIIASEALKYESINKIDIQKEFTSQVNVDLSKLKFDVASIIDIHSAEDVAEKRKAVVDYLWGGAGFPFEKLPNTITKDIVDTDFVSLKNLKQIDKITVDMEYDLNSIIYHFVPEKSNGSAAIYHQGHGGKFVLGKRTINAFLEKGYAVFALSMPLKGMNTKPVIAFERTGNMIIHSHNLMEYLEPKTGHPIKYFMEPVGAIVNYSQQFNFENLIMIGLSGGGWTTTLYAAIDPRIKISYPTAGSLPSFIRSREISNTHSLGDFEQNHAELYRRANFMELYIMGSYGKGRRQLQILNEFDPCCFRGSANKEYKDIVRDRVKSLNYGGYELFLDASHRKHQISPLALDVIFKHLENN